MIERLRGKQKQYLIHVKILFIHELTFGFHDTLRALASTVGREYFMTHFQFMRRTLGLYVVLSVYTTSFRFIRRFFGL